MAGETQHYVRRGDLAVHVADVCQVEPLEAMQVALAALIAGTAAFLGCLQILASA